MLVHPVLQDGQAAYGSAVESGMRAGGGDPDQVVDITGRCAAGQPGDLLRHVLFQRHHRDAGGQRVGLVNGEPDPASLFWRQPRRGSDVELRGQVADASEGGLVVNAGSAAMIFDPVAESVDMVPVDLGVEQLGNGSGVVGGFADGEVEVGGEPSGSAELSDTAGRALLVSEPGRRPATRRRDVARVVGDLFCFSLLCRTTDLAAHR